MRIVTGAAIANKSTRMTTASAWTLPVGGRTRVIAIQASTAPCRPYEPITTRWPAATHDNGGTAVWTAMTSECQKKCGKVVQSPFRGIGVIMGED